MVYGAMYSRARVRALEEAVGGAQKAVARSPTLLPLLSLAQDNLQVYQCNVLNLCILSL